MSSKAQWTLPIEKPLVDVFCPDFMCSVEQLTYGDLLNGASEPLELPLISRRKTLAFGSAADVESVIGPLFNVTENQVATLPPYMRVEDTWKVIRVTHHLHHDHYNNHHAM